MSPLYLSVKRIISSPKIRCVIDTLPPIFTPFRAPFSLAWGRDLLKPSTIKIKKKWARRKPCLGPLLGLKKIKAMPLIRFVKDTDYTHERIELTIGR